MRVKFRGQEVPLEWAGPEESLQQLAERAAAATGAALHTVKFVTPQRLLQPRQSPHARLGELGIGPDAVLGMLASTAGEVAQLESARSDPTMLGLAEELQRHARRRQRAPAPLKLPTEHTFGQYATWDRPGLRPPPSEALKLLHRLAADPGIARIMAQHRWSVGRLSEMPPEGLVGISPACLLGVNIGQGQEISLRLRTDDLQGFRRFDKILETLCHELAHMVYGPHDNDFKELNSKLLRECKATDEAHASARTLGGELAPDLPLEGPPAAPGGSLAQQGGHRVGSSSTEARPPRSARQAAALSAMARFAQLTPPPSPWAAPQAPAPAQPEEPPGATPLPEAATQAVSIGGEGPAGALEAPVEGLGHRDASTEAAEAAAEALGLPGGPADPALCSPAQQAVPSAAQQTMQRDHNMPEAQPVEAVAALPADPVPAEQLPQQPGSAAAAAAAGDEAAAGAREGPEVGAEEAMEEEDEGARRFRAAQREVGRLVGLAGGAAERATALATLSTVLQNGLHAGQDSRFRRVRADASSAFHRRAGRFGGAAELLGVAGFEPEQDAAGRTTFLCLKRNDPGLLWLALSAVQGQMQH